MSELWELLDAGGNKTGRLHKRGDPLAFEDYFLCVNVWIINSNGEFLITRRSASNGHKWHTTGGAVIAGDDSLQSALREAKEEIGVTLKPENSSFFKRINLPRISDGGGLLVDAWLFKQDIDIAQLVFQPEEICDAVWASPSQIRQMIEDGIFVDVATWYPYLDELLEHQQ